MSTITEEGRKVLKAFAVKAATLDGNTLAGYPSAMGNLDSYADVIFPGAFKKCLDRFKKSGFIPTDHKWEWTSLVAYPTAAEERGNRLYAECVFHSTQDAQDAKVKCQERLDAGKDVGLSIGFIILPGQYRYFNNGKELLAYAKAKGYDLGLFDVTGISAWAEMCCGIFEVEELFEYSLTPAPANREALAVAVKSHGRDLHVLMGLAPFAQLDHTPESPVADAGGRKSMRIWIKNICGKKGLSFADRDTKWDKSAADGRVREKTDATEAPNGDYAQAFVVCEGEKDQFGSYKLPFVDVVDGEMKAVWNAVKAIAEVLQGSRGGVELSDDDRAAAKRFVEAYYEKAASAFDDPDIKVPWADEEQKSIKGYYLGNVEYDMCMSAVYEAFLALWYELWACLLGYDYYEGMEDADKFDAVDGMFGEFHQICYSVIRAINSGTADETPEEAFKAVRLLAAQRIPGLADGLAYTEHLRVLADGTAEVVRRTKERLNMRLKAGRVLSEENRQRLQSHSDSLGEMCSMLSERKKDIDDMLASTDVNGSEDSETKTAEIERRRKSIALQISTLELSA